MSENKLRLIYITSLLVLASLLVMFVQGAFSGLYAISADKAEIEVNRVDLYQPHLGNYSLISVAITNNDTASHDFSIKTLYDEELIEIYNVTVKNGNTFTFGTYVLYEKVPQSENETIESTIEVAEFIVYMDDNPNPVERTSFVFKK